MTTPDANELDSAAIGVAISTYRRPAQLAELLNSLTDAVSPFQDVVLAVADNDTTISATAIVEQFRNESEFEIRYMEVTEPGVAAARNGALGLLEDRDFVAFVDDDETVPPGWLRSLVDGMARNGADVAVGPVRAVMADGVGSRFVTPTAFDFSNPKLADGAPLKWCATNNTLMSRKCIDAIPGGFDSAYGLTGGEDLHFYRRATIAGMKICWVPSARVIERIPAERASVRWLLRRSLQSGMLQARVERELEGPVAWIERFLRGLANIVRGLGIGLGNLLMGRPSEAFGGLQRMALGTGMVAGLGGFKFQTYGSTSDGRRTKP